MSQPQPDSWTVSVPEAGRLLGLGRDAAYNAARSGQLPTLRFGRRLVVPVVALRRLVEQAGAPAAAAPSLRVVAGRSDKG